MSIALRPIPLEVLDALATGDLAAAGHGLGLAVPPGFLDSQWAWAHFAALIRDEPELAWWRTQYLVVERDRILGHVRLHSMTDDRECQAGWHVEPIERGRGVAQEATRLLIGLATPRPEIDRLVALIAHDNAPSIAVARATGFADDGEQQHWTGPVMRRFVLPLPR